MKMKKIILATLGVALVGIGANANAANVTTTISPSLTITGACTVDATAVSGGFTAQPFGSTTAAGIPMTGGNLVVVCPNSAYLVGANGGVNQLAPNTRRLAVGGVAPFISYSLSLDTIAWGDAGLQAKDGTLPADTMTDLAFPTKGAGGVGALAGETYVVAGLTTAALVGTEPAGTYVDTVTITVAW